ncbi:putative HEM12-uroporphyrinogen decarboxylase [Tilletiaria anomala UBC 951]|uniref:Uroporphyrinogen decarboxylase n=1 Tax=Tilletiaria anomala (strain ATCC 24038 / CBS 436.72 / UBC 951) TaxID=1037660 RepID=A0A066WFP2_TILAU|nr:putative HEM12-uroporphyrinogen decarboxylase [Tilletiaria anomala UBC 951]KDN52621.1 putative HEM12-uroporphyrinogen decarboxylase [Tilletiaria anomala UBC 951]
MKHLNSFTTKKQADESKSKDPELRNDLIIRAARGEATPRPPVWVMRQAGRYLPEFRALREKHDFFECCRVPELAAEITLQPIRRYHGLLDAAIIFSDILVVPQAMGLEVEMLPGKGPHFPAPLHKPSDMERLKKKVDVKKELGYVMDAIKLTRQKLEGRVPLIGFCGAPWTLMAYMIEGGGSKEFEKAKKWLWAHPEESKELLQRITDVCIEFLVAQVRAGAQLLQVFDSWAGTLSPSDFRTFSLPYLRAISAGVRDALSCNSRACVPLICFAKGALGHSLPEVSKAGYDVVGLDWTVEPSVARRIVEMSSPGGTSLKAGAGANEAAHRIALQGNLDPSVLYAGKEAIRQQVDKMLRSRKGGFGGSGAHIVNLGHGITPGVDPEDMRYFLECVHEIGREVCSAKEEE